MKNSLEKFQNIRSADTVEELRVNLRSTNSNVPSIITNKHVIIYCSSKTR